MGRFETRPHLVIEIGLQVTYPIDENAGPPCGRPAEPMLKETTI
jgi:hypothetical protein